MNSNEIKAQELLKRILNYEMEDSFLDSENETHQKVFEKIKKDVSIIDFLATSSDLMVDEIIYNELVKQNSTLANQFKKDDKDSNDALKKQINRLKNNITITKAVLVFSFLLKKFKEEEIIKALKDLKELVEYGVQIDINNHEEIATSILSLSSEIQRDIIIINSYLNTFIKNIFTDRKEKIKLSLDNSKIDRALTLMTKEMEETLVSGYVLSTTLSLLEFLFNIEYSKLLTILTKCSKTTQTGFNKILAVSNVLNSELIHEAKLSKNYANNISILFITFCTLTLKTEIILNKVKEFSVFTYLNEDKLT